MIDLNAAKHNSLVGKYSAGLKLDDSSVRMRIMCADDVKVIAALEQKVFSSPWSLKSIQSFFDYSGRGFAHVCENDSAVVGYAFNVLVADELHILNVAVDEKYRRQGYGQYIVEFIVESARSNGAIYAYLELRESNEAAINLYKKIGIFLNRCA